MTKYWTPNLLNDVLIEGKIVWLEHMKEVYFAKKMIKHSFLHNLCDNFYLPRSFWHILLCMLLNLEILHICLSHKKMYEFDLGIWFFDRNS